jgi:hypothetical protein
MLTTPIIDGGLEYLPWQTYVNPGIGNAPETCSAVSATSAVPELAVSIKGGKYANMMAAIHRPMPPTVSGNQVAYAMSYTLTTDESVVLLQAHESEIRCCFTDSKGINYNPNCSLQLNQVNPKGMIQAYASANNVWADTGIVIPNLAPNTSYPITINYLLDMVGHTQSTTSINIMGKTYSLPSLFQKVPFGPQVPAWTPEMYIQVQLDLAFAGGSVTCKYSGVNLIWL